MKEVSEPSGGPNLTKDSSMFYLIMLFQNNLKESIVGAMQCEDSALTFAFLQKSRSC